MTEQSEQSEPNVFLEYMSSSKRYIKDFEKQFGYTQDELTEFINSMSETDLNNEIENVFSKTNKTFNDKYAKLCVLLCLRTLHQTNEARQAYEMKSEQADEKPRVYNAPDASVVAECNRILCDPDLSSDSMDGVLCKILSTDGKMHELIKYKLLHYKPEKKIDTSDPDFADKIKNELDTLTHIIRPYVEDSVWKINTDRKLNFRVPASKIVFSNTISQSDARNDYLMTHLTMIRRYIERISNAKSVRCRVMEDNKYHIYWLLFVITTADNSKQKGDETKRDKHRTTSKAGSRDG